MPIDSHLLVRYTLQITSTKLTSMQLNWVLAMFSRSSSFSIGVLRSSTIKRTNVCAYNILLVKVALQLTNGSYKFISHTNRVLGSLFRETINEQLQRLQETLIVDLVHKLQQY